MRLRLLYLSVATCSRKDCTARIRKIPYIEGESAVYRIIDGQNIGPRFLGYFSRVIGILLEYIAAC